MPAPVPAQKPPVPEEPLRSLPPAQAVRLGILQGPTELLPVSSSAHLRLAPWLAGWRHEELDPELRKAFEVAVHAGAAAALLAAQRRLIAAEARGLGPRRLTMIALSFLPAAIAGLAFERRIERHLGGPGGTAAGLALGAGAMMVADRRPGDRDAADAGPADGLAVGLAQASALVPGVSRNGATLAAARLRGFGRAQANLLSRTVALPVIAGATLLKGVRLARRGIPAGVAGSLAIGAGAAFGSTLASQGLIRLLERDRALWPYAAYRIGLALFVLARLRRGSVAGQVESSL